MKIYFLLIIIITLNDIKYKKNIKIINKILQIYSSTKRLFLKLN